jgi:outer membrane protein assembly factor BamB
VTRAPIRTLLALVLLVVAGLIGWRVLSPAEVLDPATDPYPAAPARGPGVTGKTAAAPLIVDGRIRVFAAKRQVKADAPVNARTAYTPRWSLRRWPQQLNGVVAIGATVISRWSDGELVAIDGRTGRIAWRSDGPDAGGYTGGKTGATTVWAPPGLLTSGNTVLVRGGGRVLAVDALSGRARWQADCGGVSFVTVGGQLVCGAAAYEVATGQAAEAWPTGPFTEVGCAVAHSACAGLRDADGRGWITGARTPQRAGALDTPGNTVRIVQRTTATGRVASALAFSTGAVVVARSPLTGGELWNWSGPRGATVLGAGPDSVFLLTGDRQLVTVDASTGEVRTQFPLAVGTENTDWKPGLWQVVDGYVAVERLKKDGDPFTVETVLLAAGL